MNFLTDFADQAVIMPVVFIIFLCIAKANKKQALVWLGGIGAFLFLVLIGKMFVHACGQYLPEWDLKSPSGHTASSSLVYGALIGYIIQDKTFYRTFLIAFLIAIIFGFSRLYLEVHTVADVVTGGLIGTLGATMVRYLQVKIENTTELQMIHIRKIAIVVGVVFIALHGIHFNQETKIHGYSRVIWPMTLCTKEN